MPRPRWSTAGCDKRSCWTPNAPRSPAMTRCACASGKICLLEKFRQSTVSNVLFGCPMSCLFLPCSPMLLDSLQTRFDMLMCWPWRTKVYLGFLRNLLFGTSGKKPSQCVLSFLLEAYFLTLVVKSTIFPKSSRLFCNRVFLLEIDLAPSCADPKGKSIPPWYSLLSFSLPWWNNF